MIKLFWGFKRFSLMYPETKWWLAFYLQDYTKGIRAINFDSVPRAKLMPSRRSLSVNGRGEQALLKMIIFPQPLSSVVTDDTTCYMTANRMRFMGCSYWLHLTSRLMPHYQCRLTTYIHQPSHPNNSSHVQGKPDTIYLKHTCQPLSILMGYIYERERNKETIFKDESKKTRMTRQSRLIS